MVSPLRNGNDQNGKRHYRNVAFYVLVGRGFGCQSYFYHQAQKCAECRRHDNNKLGATGLTNVTCTGCSLSGTTFTPSGDLANAGKSLKITVTYTDDLTASTPVKTYAVTCEEAPYKITYDSNGGSAVAAQEYEKTTNITLAAAPTKFGYTFSGWKVQPKVAGRSVLYILAKRWTGNYGLLHSSQWTPNRIPYG